MQIDLNKKVLLRERKRHTARHVASACYAALSQIQPMGGGRGIPPSSPDRGGGVSCSGKWGTPSWLGVPPIGWMGVPPISKMGVPLPPCWMNGGTLLHWPDGVIPPPGNWLDGGTSPHLDGGTSRPRNGLQSENITSRRTTYAGGN